MSGTINQAPLKKNKAPLKKNKLSKKSINKNWDVWERISRGLGGVVRENVNGIKGVRHREKRILGYENNEPPVVIDVIEQE